VPESRTPVAAPAHEDTVREFAEYLAEMVGGDASRRTARELLSLVWDNTPAWISAHADDSVPQRVRETAITAARRHAQGEPLAYATGRAAFRDLVLTVDERVLIPRPETEIVVGEALRVCRSGIAADVGTGTGAIALAMAMEGAFDRVIATDVSTDALAVARANVQRISPPVPVELRCGSLLDPLRGEAVDLLVSNPPYVAAAEVTALPGAVRDWEPPLALLSAGNGLAHTHAIIAQSAGVIRPGGWIILEIDSTRAEAVAAMLSACDWLDSVAIRPDLTGRPRVAIARRNPAATTERVS
jgi:release factor glutamine methyltransferase